MDKSRLQVSRRQVLASAIVGGATIIGLEEVFAQLSDSEKSNDNAIQASTLDLKTDGSDSVVTILDVSAVVPGESGSGSVDLNNSGKTAGTLDVTLDVMGDTEGTTGGADGTGGELDSNLELSGSFAGSTIWSYETARNLETNTYTLDKSFDSGVSNTFTLRWRLPDYATLDSKKDGVTVRLKFSLKE